MPIYRYRHEEEWIEPEYESDTWQCEPIFEIFQKMSEDAFETCPECGLKVRKVLVPCNLTVTASAESPDASVKRLLGVKRGEQTHINPYTQETLQLKGSRRDREDQIRRSYDTDDVPKKVREAVKDRNKCTFPNL